MARALLILLAGLAILDLAASHALLTFLEPLELDLTTRAMAYAPGAAVLGSVLLVHRDDGSRFLARTIWWAVLIYGAASAVDGLTGYAHWLALVLASGAALAAFPMKPAAAPFDGDLRVAASVSLVHGFFSASFGFIAFDPDGHMWLFNLMGIVAGAASLVAGAGLYRARVWAVPLGIVGAAMILWLTAGSLALVWSHGLVPFALAGLQLLLLTNIGLAVFRGEGRPISRWADWPYRTTIVPLLLTVTLGATGYWLAMGHALRLPLGPQL